MYGIWPQTEANTRPSREARVAEFMDKTQKKYHKDNANNFLVLDLFIEEFLELRNAYYEYMQHPNVETRKQLVKEWADCQVTLSNIAWFFDIDGDEAFKRVHENNMTKLIDGELKRREDGKILKPEGYKPPDMRGI